MVHENKKGFGLNGTHNLLVHADGVNLPGENINTIEHIISIRRHLVADVVYVVNVKWFHYKIAS
jgi:hypothetical protein